MKKVSRSGTANVPGASSVNDTPKPPASPEALSVEIARLREKVSQLVSKKPTLAARLLTQWMNRKQNAA